MALPEHPRAGLVICHAHPLHGGTMRSVVNGALFEALPRRGVACLRFNFRGVEGSEGTHDGGVGERLDAQAALRHLAASVADDLPLAIAGWSFGADVALSVQDPRHAGWFAVAPPLRFGEDLASTAADARPKQFVLGERDQFRRPEDVEGEVASWVNARAEVIGGADHYFIGRTDRVVDLADAFLTSVSEAR